MNRLGVYALCAMLATVLCACGGGGGGSSSPVPGTTSSSSSGGVSSSSSSSSSSGGASNSSSSSSGSSSSSSSGSSVVKLGACLSLNVGSKYESYDSNGSAPDKLRTSEIISDTFEGLTTVAVKASYIDAQGKTNIDTLDEYIPSAVGLGMTGFVAYMSNPNVLYGQATWSPTWTIPANLLVGETSNYAYTETVSWKDAKGNAVAPASISGTLKFMGVEDLTTSPGVSFKNACKIMITGSDLAGPTYAWLADGYGPVRVELTDGSGKVTDFWYVTRRLTAP